MKAIYILLGFIFLGLGIVGIILPLLPATPFLLLTLFFLQKGLIDYTIGFCKHHGITNT
ncbi:putative transmembrane protein [Pasteurella multocida subsp. septica]|nr:putative transmembrane protein [Pasteurella multocida subsp. septica]